MGRRGRVAARGAGAGLALFLCLSAGPVLYPKPAGAAEGGLSREAARTWERALVIIDLGGFSFIHGRLDEADTRGAMARLLTGRKLPTVIYLHGCSGLGGGNIDWMFVLARAGYAVIAPDSFARAYRPRTCDPRVHGPVPGAPFRRVAGMRQEEIRHAVSQARALPWVDRERLFLFGHSQGGTAAAAYEGAEFRARVVSGSRCQRGVRAPAAEPVLSIYSERDPWARGRSPRGCLERAAVRGRPIAFHLFPGSAHNLAKNPAARALILGFLDRHAAPRP